MSILARMVAHLSMITDMIPTLYKKLLSLYPRAFKEQLDDSMLQTFNDLQREYQTRRGLSGFVVWIFIETTIGIFREHLLLMEGNAMKNMFMTFRWPALLSLLLIAPFMIMELVNRRGLDEGFPILLFTLMWILPVIFILTVTPLIRNLRAGNSLIAQPANLLIRVLLLIIVAWMWTTLLVDQMPCFLGVPNCD